MLKVLIADDEQKVAKLIRYLVDWSHYGMEIIGEASDGQSAFDMIIEKTPDLIITDIRMPGINGIELVQKVKESGLAPFFVIISGYSEFSYAQKAIQLGVEDYLLKPLKKKDLENVLMKVVSKYHTDLQNKEETSSLLNELDQSKQKIKNHLLTDILIKRDPTVITMSDTELSSQYHYIISDYHAICMVLQLFTGPEDGTLTNREIYSFVLPKLSERMETVIKPLTRDYISVNHENKIILLASYDSGKVESIYERLQKVKVSLLNYSNFYPNLRAAVGISREITTLTSLTTAYQDACSALGQRFSSPDKFAFQCEVPPLSEIALSSSSTNSLWRQLEEATELMNTDSFKTSYDAIIDLLRHNRVNIHLIYEYFQTLIDSFLYVTGSLNNVDTSQYLNRETLLHSYDSIYEFEDLFDYLRNSLADAIDKIAAEKKHLENKPIRSAKQYILDHFMEPLTLETVSTEIGFNPAYFSSLFKKTTGQNFMEYLKDVRISNAKSMLQYTDADVNTIANNVGYSDIKYFSKLFRSKTGLTPSEFRKLYG